MERAMDLLEDAEDFLGAAGDLYKTKRWSKVCFFCQQSAELAVKAALNALGLERKGHDLSELLEELSQHDRDVKRFEDMTKTLDQYYIPTSYANAFYRGPAKQHYTQGQAAEALRYAEAILEMMKSIVTKRKA